MGDNDTRPQRKEYLQPKIIHTEKIEARAVSCFKGTDAVCAGGPLQS